MERNPAIADSQVAEATLHLKGVTLRARDCSGDMMHSINLCSDEVGVQVKRHRDKRRRRREARAAAAAPLSLDSAQPARGTCRPPHDRGRARRQAAGAALSLIVALMGLASAGARSGACGAAEPAGPRQRAGRRAGARARGRQLRGVNRSGLEYACIQGWGFFDSPHPDRIDDPSMIAAMRSWDINAVRVPLNEDCWLGLHTAPGRGGAPYRRIVPRYVRALNAARLYVILDLHLAAPGAARATRQPPMADRDHAPAFWRSVARTFEHDHALIFDLYNEPFGIGWGCWQHGCRLPGAAAGSPRTGRPACRRWSAPCAPPAPPSRCCSAA